MSKIVLNGFEIDPTPVMLPDGKYTARAAIVRMADRQVEELWPEYEPFTTEVEAQSAGHLAAVAWVASRISESHPLADGS